MLFKKTIDFLWTYALLDNLISTYSASMYEVTNLSKGYLSKMKSISIFTINNSLR